MAEEYGVEYVEVTSGTLNSKMHFMFDKIQDDMRKMYDPIVEFVRD